MRAKKAVGGRHGRKVVEGEEKEKESYEAKWRRYLVAVSLVNPICKSMSQQGGL